jgi:hypothetical protein
VPGQRDADPLPRLSPTPDRNRQIALQNHSISKQCRQFHVTPFISFLFAPLSFQKLLLLACARKAACDRIYTFNLGYFR